MPKNDEPSLVEVLQSVEPTVPEEIFELVVILFEWIMSGVYKVHDFFTRSREE